jgi:hypothetical protein
MVAVIAENVGRAGCARYRPAVEFVRFPVSLLMVESVPEQCESPGVAGVRRHLHAQLLFGQYKVPSLERCRSVANRCPVIRDPAGRWAKTGRYAKK